MSRPIAAALIVGGRSTRMGRDKALLPIGTGGEALWRIQLSKLAALDPAQLLISGREDLNFPGAESIADAARDAGPLAGIAACLRASTQPLLLCQALDMPRMTTEFLSQQLLARATPECGVVPKIGDRWEPLAAVYPKSLESLAFERLAGDDRSLQSFVRQAEAAGKIETWQVEKADEIWFENVNTPEDWESLKSYNLFICP